MTVLKLLKWKLLRLEHTVDTVDAVQSLEEGELIS